MLKTPQFPVEYLTLVCPKKPPHEAKGGRAGAVFHSGFFRVKNFFKPKKNLEKNLNRIALRAVNRMSGLQKCD